MKPIANYDSIEAQGNEEYKRLVPGGYVCRIIKVEDRPEKSYLYMELDISEGEYMNYASNCMERNGFWPIKLYRSYSDKAAGKFKGFIQQIESVNPGYHWDWKEQTLVGRCIGVILGEEEYKKMDGSVGTRLNITRTKTPEDIRSGNFKVPEKKTLPKEEPTTGFTPIDSESELPF